MSTTVLACTHVKVLHTYNYCCGSESHGLGKKNISFKYLCFDDSLQGVVKIINSPIIEFRHFLHYSSMSSLIVLLGRAERPRKLKGETIINFR